MQCMAPWRSGVCLRRQWRKPRVVATPSEVTQPRRRLMPSKYPTPSPIDAPRPRLCLRPLLLGTIATPQPFTAPAVRPETMRRWKISTSPTTGMVTITEAAMMLPQGSS